ncbi:MAG: hypothetical protein JWO09_2641 [Bacteroidetes bacterium]|nr:hypothetical protein [Bacteroidota bacterium]
MNMALSETTTTEKDALINRLVEFISSVGIDVQEGLTGDVTFVPGLDIQNGTLIFDRKKLLYPGDLLHEAGHIAVTTAAERKLLHGNVTGGMTEKEGEEMAAMLWSYAAAVKLGISPAVVFHPNGYKGDSLWLLDNYSKNVFIGIPLITWMGMTTKEQFPIMKKWLRD